MSGQGPRNTHILIKNDEIIGFGDICEKSFHPKKANIETKNGVIEIYPIDNDGVERKWVFSRKNVESVKNELSVKYNKSKKKYEIIRTKKNINYKTVWVGDKFNAKTYGTQLLRRIIKKDFPFPKSLYAVCECIKAVVHTSNSIILDFFAGSGTTAHAVLELNKQDNGNRHFIICTNNENGICEEVCYPRVINVIKGYKDADGNKVEGLGGNLKYFKTSFVKKNLNSDQLKINITNKCTEMLCLKEGVFDLVEEDDDYKIFKQSDKVMAVYYSFLSDSLKNLKKKLDKITGVKILYCFTLDPLGLDKNNFLDWDNIILEPIPQKILDIYEEIYEY